MSSLIPERHLVISPSLAATIGLEEAVLLGYLSTLKHFSQGELSRGFDWYRVSAADLQTELAFWQLRDLQRICTSLRDKGIILISSPPLTDSAELRFAFNRNERASNSKPAQVPAETTSHSPAKFQSARTISANWQPDDTTLALIGQRGIPSSFAESQIAAFVQYWHERGEARHTWGNRFVQQVLREWQRFEATQGSEPWQAEDSRQTTGASDPVAMHRGWRPSQDATEILRIQTGVSPSFIEDAIPEFILFWSEKGEKSNTWNARFITHVKRQWACFQHAVENDSDPRPLPEDWQPSADCWDVLRLARIDDAFAHQQLPEFILYWRDRNEARASWNTTFLQFIKRQWQIQHDASTSESTRNRKLIDDLTDTSWAS